MKHRRLIVVPCLLVLVGSAALPPVQVRVFGLLSGESFYEGLPTRYWREKALVHDRIRLSWTVQGKYGQAPPPLPWTELLLTCFRVGAREERPDFRILAGDPKALGVLLELLTDPDIAVQETACEGLIPLGPVAAPAVPALVEVLLAGRMTLLIDENDCAQLALEKIGAAAVPVLLDKLREYGPRTEVIIDTLGGIGPAACTAFPTLKEAVRKYPRAAADALVRIDPNAALPVLLEGMKSTDPGLRLAASEALYLTRGDPALLVPAYVRLLRDEDGLLRRSAAYGLGELKEDGLPGIIEALKSPDPEVVGEAKSGLHWTPGARVILIRMLNKEQDAERRRWIELAIQESRP